MVQLTNVHKDYSTDGAEVCALKGITLSIPGGQFVALLGPSGCGKSTLLHLVGGLDRPSAGEITVAGQRLTGLDEAALTRLRRHTIGIVFQFFNLLPNLTVRENILLPLVMQNQAAKSIEGRADQLLDRVGLAHRAHQRPHQLSGGEQQRTAVARALMIQPQLLLADEPTGNLDSESGATVVQLLKSLPEQFGTTILLATHDREVAAAADRQVRLKDGRIVGDTV